ncbi:MAG: hypothetical protein HC877_02775 [Thioploca sp.]|nr:hypothetical protein [Thioploca sp.]
MAILLKLSEESIKISNPGLLQVRRFLDDQGMFNGDMIYDQLQPPTDEVHLVNLNAFSVHPALIEGHTILSTDIPYQDLLIPVWRNGKPVIELPSLDQIRQRTQAQLNHCPIEIQRLNTPAIYPVNLEIRLYQLKQRLISEARHVTNS